MVTQVKVIKATGLGKQESYGADPYCIVSCEGEKVTTHVVNNTVNPEWGDSAVFYRKNPVKHPLKIQIWNSNVLRDSHLGKHVSMSTDDFYNSVLEVSLIGRKNEGSTQNLGKLVIQVTQSRQLTSV